MRNNNLQLKIVFTFSKGIPLTAPLMSTTRSVFSLTIGIKILDLISQQDFDGVDGVLSGIPSGW